MKAEPGGWSGSGREIVLAPPAILVLGVESAPKGLNLGSCSISRGLSVAFHSVTLFILSELLLYSQIRVAEGIDEGYSISVLNFDH